MYIVTYHYVRDLSKGRFKNIKGLDLELFRKQISYFEQNFNFVSSKQVIDAIYYNEELPDKSILLTFDDGYIDHYKNVFPILLEKKIPAFFSMPGKIIKENKVLDVNKIHFILASTSVKNILELVFKELDYYRGNEFQIESNESLYKKLAFPSRFDTAEVIFIKRLLQVELDEKLRNIITDSIFKKCVGVNEKDFSKELYMNLEQVKEMANNGMCWGIHGYDHYWMNKLTEEKLEKDIDKALNVFDSIIDTNQWICCYPYGAYDDNVINIVKSKGAIAGFSTSPGITKLSKEEIFKLKRFDTNDFPPKSENYREDLKDE